MNKRERIMEAIRHREADRVPKGEICIEAGIANRLLKKEYSNAYQDYERDKAVRELLKIDFINIGDWPQDYLGRDEKGRELYRSIYGYEFVTAGASKHIVRPPVERIEDAAQYRVPDISRVSGELVRKFRDTTDLFVFAQIGGPVSMVNEMFDMTDYMIYSMTNTAELGLIGERVMEFEIAKAKLFLDNGADAILIADDIAFNSGTLLPPRIMDEIVFPLHRAAVEEIKRCRDVPVFFHSDGDLRSVMDTIVKNGFDGLHSLQPSAGMDIGEIKRNYGETLCLVGNIDLDHVMTFAPPQEVADVVRRTIDIAAPGGGYILATCNTLIDAIPEQNALANYETAQEYGSYQ